jgi:outer membrane protein TolC
VRRADGAGATPRTHDRATARAVIPRSSSLACALAVAVALVLPRLARAEGAPPITLQEAIRRAVARNPSWATAQEEIRRADALVKEARAASLPTLYGNATYTRLDADRTLNGSVVSAANQFNANVVLDVPIIQPHNWAQWSHAGDNADVARTASADVGRQVALAVGHAYLAVVWRRSACSR